MNVNKLCLNQNNPSICIWSTQESVHSKQPQHLCMEHTGKCSFQTNPGGEDGPLTWMSRSDPLLHTLQLYGWELIFKVYPSACFNLVWSQTQHLDQTEQKESSFILKRSFRSWSSEVDVVQWYSAASCTLSAGRIGSKLQALVYDILPGGRCRKAMLGVWVGSWFSNFNHPCGLIQVRAKHSIWSTQTILQSNSNATREVPHKYMLL